MRRSITAVAALLVTLSFAGTVQAAEHQNVGVGFHESSAPIGLRWWLSGQKVGIDVGLGFDSEPAPSYADEKLSSWRLDLGVPLVIKSWDRVHFMVRPGFLYASSQVEATTPPTAFDTENFTGYRISGELEAEVFLVDNVSVSASHGIAYNSVNPPGSGDSITSFGTFGNNFTNVGFHVYFLGGGGN